MRAALARRQKKPQEDRLLDELDKFEIKLQKWIDGSEKNARQFRKDPLGAMMAAGLDVEDDIMLELENITRAIARKLK